jgi:hypothetical protein
VPPIDPALPAVVAPTAEASAQPNAEQLANRSDEPAAAESESQEAGGEVKAVEKKEKTPEQREIERARRKIDRLVAQREQLRAQLGQSSPAQQPPRGDTNDPSQVADEKVTLSQAALQKLIREEAEKLAPVLTKQNAEIEHRQEIVQELAKEWGQEKFDAYASDLEDAFGGLADHNGKPKPATDAIFESEMPAALIEYLADPDNADEAEALSRMSASQAGRAIAKLEDKVAAKKAAEKAKAKPEPSKAAAPIENVRGGGGTIDSMPDPANTKAYMKWANREEFGR